MLHLIRTCSSPYRRNLFSIGPISAHYTNDFTKGLDNKIKPLKGNAYGYRNLKKFRSHILHIFTHNSLINKQPPDSDCSSLSNNHKFQARSMVMTFVLTKNSYRLIKAQYWWDLFYRCSAYFFKFMAANLCLTQFVTWDKPRYGVHPIAYFSFASANTRAIVFLFVVRKKPCTRAYAWCLLPSFWVTAIRINAVWILF